MIASFWEVQTRDKRGQIGGDLSTLFSDQVIREEEAGRGRSGMESTSAATVVVPASWLSSLLPQQIIPANRFAPPNPSSITSHSRSKLSTSIHPIRRRGSRVYCHKMYVPGFGESPESKAANYLVSFFTYIALEIVSSQLRSYNREAHAELMEFLESHPLKDGDDFCAALMRRSSRHKGLALRIIEVRSAYCKMDFEWDNLQRLALKKVGDSNTRLMRDYVSETSHET